MKKNLKPLEESSRKSQEFTLISLVLSQRTKNPGEVAAVVVEVEAVEAEEAVAEEEAEVEDLVATVKEEVLNLK